MCSPSLSSLRISDVCNSTYGKAFSVFGRELDMMTQDSLRFYKSHAVYPNFGGVVLDREEGRKIAECLGNGKAAILQNHGLITVYIHLPQDARISIVLG
jgi:ribulose-5-phosphate 4-epimerase/fuculose-1-phosphate aldolase